MNDSPVVSEPDTRTVCVRPRALLRWHVHGAEMAAVALGAAVVGMQGVRLGPATWLTDDAGVALALAHGSAGPADGILAPAGGRGWLQLLALGPPGAWALLCFAAALYAATGTVRTLRGRRAWPFTLGTAGVFAACPPALGWLFSGTSGALSLLVVALVVRTVAGAAVSGRLPSERTAAGAGLLTGISACAVPGGLVLGAVYPAALLLAGRRRGATAAALRGGAVHAAVWATAVWAMPWPLTAVSAAATAHATEYATQGVGAVLLAACTAARAAVPVRLAAVAVGAALLLPGPGLPAAVALALCGGLLIVGRGPAARIVGTAALAGAVGVLWVGALGIAGSTVLVACSLAVAAAWKWRASRAAWPPGPWGTVERRHLAALRRKGAAGLRQEPGRQGATGPSKPPQRRAIHAARTSAATPRSVIIGLLVGGTLFAGLAQDTPPPPAANALCFTEARYGRMFATYAELLGLERSTVALASPGGALLLGEQRVLDLRGRTNPRVAAARAAHDDAALRRYLFVHARPEFVHVDAAEAARTGLTAKRLAAHGYRPLLRQGAGGDFVHRSALTAPERLPRLRAWARAAAARIERGGCPSADGRQTAAAERPAGDPWS